MARILTRKQVDFIVLSDTTEWRAEETRKEYLDLGYRILSTNKKQGQHITIVEKVEVI